MLKRLRGLYYFLPVQLVLLHLRKYQLLLIFWFILTFTIAGHFAKHFGASSLFVAPEYLGNISFVSMLLLGGAVAVFIMAWHITTFIVHSKRIPFVGATRQAFLIYCINNSVIPLAFLVFYSIMTIRFQWYQEQTPMSQILLLQVGFYIGFGIIITLSFLYFFRVGRDLLKVMLAKFANPAPIIKEIIPYDTLDDEIDILRSETFLTGRFKIRRCSEYLTYQPRLLNTILRRHHRNALFGGVFAYILLLLLGIFMDEPALRIPAGAGFLLLFAIMMGFVGAVKYFLKSWEIIGWVLIIIVLSLMVHYRLFDLRSIAYGLDYHTSQAQEPTYNYDHLREVFTSARYTQDKTSEENRLTKWKAHNATPTQSKPPLVVLTISGGGLRSAYLTFRTLQYLDSATQGKLFKSTVLITGASGGMLGAAYWRSLHDAHMQGVIKNPYAVRYQQNIGKDLLNPIIFSLATVDLISPFNKISLAGYSYTKDRGYAMEQELIRNSEGLLDKKIGDYKQGEADGVIPQMIINGTIINDGRKLMISAQPLSYLTQPEYSLQDSLFPVIDAVDFATLFSQQNPYNLRLTSALRINATFPYILPVVRMPSQPRMNVMDAGLRDNFGTEVAARYVYTMRNWLNENAGDVLFIEIRDTREQSVLTSIEQTSLVSMLVDPLVVFQEKWQVFQSYAHGHLKDYMPHTFNDKLHIITFEYMPKDPEKSAALSFHLTQDEKDDLYNSIFNKENQHAVQQVMQFLNQQNQ